LAQGFWLQADSQQSRMHLRWPQSGQTSPERVSDTASNADAPAGDDPSTPVGYHEYDVGTVSETPQASVHSLRRGQGHLQVEQGVFVRAEARSAEGYGTVDNVVSRMTNVSSVRVESHGIDGAPGDATVISDDESESELSSSSSTRTSLDALRVALARQLPRHIIANVWSSAGSRTSTAAVCEDPPDPEVWASVARLRRPMLHRVSTPSSRNGDREMYLSDSPDPVLAELQADIDQAVVLHFR